MYNLPLHVVILNCTNNLNINFLNNEKVSIADLIKKFNFNENISLKDDSITDLYLNVIKNKILLGERIFINDYYFLNNYLKSEIKQFLYYYNIIFFNLIENNNNYYILNNNNREKININSVKLCKKIKNLKEIFNKWNGITVVGDVHGEINRLLSVVNWVKKRNNFLILLGDLINYGENSIECINLVYDMINKNECQVLLGNHDQKIYNWFIGKKINIYKPVEETINKFTSLSKREFDILKMKFKTIINNGAIALKYKNCYFVHACLNEKIKNALSNNIPLEKEDINICVLGNNFNKKNNNENDKLNISWIENIPKNCTVFVGHNYICNIPVIMKNSLGSKCIFMDTGSGKGGKLSSVDIKFNEITKNLEIINFNLW